MFAQFESIPEMLREPLALWWERAAAQPGFLEAYEALSQDLRAELPARRRRSEFIGSVLIQDTQALDWLSRNETPSAARRAGAEYESRAAAAPSVTEAQRILREWRRREMLRIAWRDIAGRAGTTETLHALSDFADAAIRAAAAAAQLHLRPVFGSPRDAAAKEVPLIVLGMGKLGGRELNFSSDIDLVFLFSQAGQTDGPREIENEEYFNRLAARSSGCSM